MPIKEGEEVSHYIRMWKEKEPMSTGKKIKSREQAIAIGLSEAQRAKAKKKKRVRARKEKKQKKAERKRNPPLGVVASWVSQPDPLLQAATGLRVPRYMTYGTAIALGLLLAIAKAGGKKQTEKKSLLNKK